MHLRSVNRHTRDAFVLKEQLFQEDVVMPAQFHPRPQATWLQKLQLAVLEAAIHDWRTWHQTNHSLAGREELAVWFSSDADGPFTFRTICDCLDIEPTGLWVRLREMVGRTTDGGARECRACGETKEITRHFLRHRNGFGRICTTCRAGRAVA